MIDGGGYRQRHAAAAWFRLVQHVSSTVTRFIFPKYEFAIISMFMFRKNKKKKNNRFDFIAIYIVNTKIEIYVHFIDDSWGRMGGLNSKYSIFNASHNCNLGCLTVPNFHRVYKKLRDRVDSVLSDSAYLSLYPCCLLYRGYIRFFFSLSQMLTLAS